MLQTKMTQEGKDLRVSLSGVLDENAVLPALKDPPAGRLILDLENVELINSLGCRNWINWIKGKKAADGVVLTHCSPVVVKQINILSGFLGEDAQIESVFVPYFCEECSHEQNALVKIKDLHDTTKFSEIDENIPCPQCGKSMVLDVNKAQYFHFVVQQNAKYNISR